MPSQITEIFGMWSSRTLVNSTLVNLDLFFFFFWSIWTSSLVNSYLYKVRIDHGLSGVEIRIDHGLSGVEIRIDQGSSGIKDPTDQGLTAVKVRIARRQPQLTSSWGGSSRTRHSSSSNSKEISSNSSSRVVVTGTIINIL